MGTKPTPPPDPRDTGWLTAPKIAAALAERGMYPRTRAGVNKLAEKLPSRAMRRVGRWREYDLAAVVQHVRDAPYTLNRGALRRDGTPRGMGDKNTTTPPDPDPKAANLLADLLERGELSDATAEQLAALSGQKLSNLLLAEQILMKRLERREREGVLVPLDETLTRVRRASLEARQHLAQAPRRIADEAARACRLSDEQRHTIQQHAQTAIADAVDAIQKSLTEPTDDAADAAEE